MKEDFEYLPLENPHGGKSIIAWDLAQWERGKDPRRPLRLEVAIPLLDQTPTGMPQGSETDELADLNRRLVRLVRRHTGARLAMRVTGVGADVHVFYVPAKVGLVRRQATPAKLEPLLARFGNNAGREVEVSWHDDPEWSRLLGIFRSHDPKQFHTDRALVLHMWKARDAIMEKRSVAHRSFFEDRDQCRAFLKDARQRRYKPEGGPKKSDKADGGEWTVVVERVEPTIGVWHIHPVALEVKELAERHGGTYDGWETELIPRTDPVPLVPPGGAKLG